MFHFSHVPILKCSLSRMLPFSCVTQGPKTRRLSFSAFLFNHILHCICFKILFTVSIHSFIPAISIVPLQVLYCSGALPTTARILYQSFTLKRTGNCR